GPDTIALAVSDETGAPVAAVEALDFRSVTAEQLAAAGDRDSAQEDLFQLDWVSLPVTPAFPEDGWAVLGDSAPALLPALKGAEIDATVHPTLSGLREEIAAGVPAPSAVLVPIGDLVGALPDTAA